MLEKIKQKLINMGLKRARSKRYIRFEYIGQGYGFIQIDPRTLEITTKWVDENSRKIIEYIEGKLYEWGNTYSRGY